MGAESLAELYRHPVGRQGHVAAKEIRANRAHRETSAAVKRIVCPMLALLAGATAAWSQGVPSGARAMIPDRTIRISGETRYVNVMRYETVRFVLAHPSGQESSFDWHVDRSPRSTVPLAQIAPSGVSGFGAVLIHIQREPPTD